MTRDWACPRFASVLEWSDELVLVRPRKPRYVKTSFDDRTKTRLKRVVTSKNDSLKRT